MPTYRVATFAPMERLIRPFVPVRPVLAADRRSAPVVPPVEEAIVEWGAETSPEFSGRRSGDGFKVEVPSGDDPPDLNTIIIFQEVGTREVVRVRVENPDNAEQWVEFDDPLTVTFRPPPELKRPGDELWQLKFIDQATI